MDQTKGIETMTRKEGKAAIQDILAGASLIPKERRVYRRNCSREEWTEFIKVMHSGEIFEADEEMAYYWLEVLPPVFMGRDILFLPGHEGHPMRVWFGFAEGAEPITVFWRNLYKNPHEKAEYRYFGQRTNKINPVA